MEKNNPTVWQRFVHAKMEMPAPTKDTDADKYKYADLAQVRGIVMPALYKNGLDLTQNQVDGWLYTCVVDTLTGETVLQDSRKVLEQGTDQQRGSSETYQRRYAMLTVCGLAPEDDDGAAASKAPEIAPVDAAKHRLWAAIKAYAANHNADAKQLLEGVQKRPEYAETVEFFETVAIEFETAE